MRADLKFYSMGNGPYYTLYRPFHLCSIETPQAVAEAVIYGESVLEAAGRMVASGVRCQTRSEGRAEDRRHRRLDFFSRHLQG